MQKVGVDNEGLSERMALCAEKILRAEKCGRLADLEITETKDGNKVPSSSVLYFRETDTSGLSTLINANASNQPN
ncbi:MAG: hypothetical protein JNL67_07235 [Planctomycetaceae bacterium]|nr:hypothetical protein [Planctomycetaceae bacterium]